MSNAADDPEHRPPPRQGDPQPYPGEPYPGYAQPYADAAWQGDPRQADPQPGGPPPYAGPPYEAAQQPPYQPGGYTPAGPPYPAPNDPAQHPGGYAAPAYPPAQAPRPKPNFFSALFDTDFDQMITVRLARTIYVIILLLVTLFALIVLWYGFSFLSWNTVLGVMTIIAAPLIWIFDLVIVRVFMEFVINQFKITEHLKAIREQREPR